MKRVLAAAKTIYNRYRNGLAPAPFHDRPEVERKAISEIRQNGFAVIERYYDDDKTASIRADLERVIREYSEKLWRDELDSDVRVFAAESVSPPIAAFHHDELIGSLARLYMNEEQTCFFTMANRVMPVSGNLGSGGGWHRDTPHERQFKSILYLSDVSGDNGPFEYVPGSHHLGFLVRTILRSGIQYGQNRFSDAEIARILDRSRASTKRFTAPAGTLLLIDSSGIHRGSPIVSGLRYALTNYFFRPSDVEQLRARGKFVNYFVNRTVL
jgi:ectoine hydroxylase-related dioxygenase (phytanoyl-CoA dioxygenase family)